MYKYMYIFIFFSFFLPFLSPSSIAIVQSIKDGDYVLPYLNRSKQGTQWDLRRKRDTKTVEVTINNLS